MKIRIAWIDKFNNKYCYGDWRDKTKKQLNVLKKWVILQNNTYHETYYWLESKFQDKIENYPLLLLEDLDYMNINIK